MAAQPPNLRSINLPGRLLEAWRSAVLALAKFPRGTPRSELSADELLDLVRKQETKTIIELWETFTQERGNLSRKLLATSRQTVAYLLGFHLVNAARAALLLRRMDERHNLSHWVKQQAASPHPMLWYDLGCGTGAVAHVVTDFLLQGGLPPARLELHLYDGVATLLDAASRVLTAAGVVPKTHRLFLEALDPARMPGAEDPRVRGYSMGYVWNELEKNPAARAKLKQLFVGQVAAKTMILILEPATQGHSRAAMELRDELVAAGYQPLYPCPSALPCPMLKLTRDWCFSEGEWQQPKLMQQVDKAVGIDRTRLNGTLMGLVSPRLAADLAEGEVGPVVVGRPERLQGKKGADYLLCEAGELRKKEIEGAGGVARGEIYRG